MLETYKLRCICLCAMLPFPCCFVHASLLCCISSHAFLSVTLSFHMLSNSFISNLHQLNVLPAAYGNLFLNFISCQRWNDCLFIFWFIDCLNVSLRFCDERKLVKELCIFICSKWITEIWANKFCKYFHQKLGEWWKDKMQIFNFKPCNTHNYQAKWEISMATRFDFDTALVFVEIQYLPQDFQNLGRLFLSLSLFVLLSPPPSVCLFVALFFKVG